MKYETDLKHYPDYTSCILTDRIGHWSLAGQVCICGGCRLFTILLRLIVHVTEVWREAVLLRAVPDCTAETVFANAVHVVTVSNAT